MFLSWEAGTPSESGTLPFRTDQLLFRRHEIYLAYSALSSLVKHSHTPEIPEIPRLQTIDGSNIQWESWFKSRPEDLPLVDCDDNIALVGHSFGGATVVSSHHLCCLLSFIFVSSGHSSPSCLIRLLSTNMLRYLWPMP